MLSNINVLWASLAISLLAQPLNAAGHIPVRRQTTDTDTDTDTRITFKSAGNPILADGSVFSADPAPLVVNDTLYILTGRDEAGPEVNGFVMNEWQIFESKNPDPAGAEWTLHRNVGQPQAIFSWAREGAAYASQIVQGPDGRFYLYAPVTQKSTTASDPFAIGVAVSDSPLGPFADAHPSGPIISQTVPAPGNDIQNIDPTVLVDDGDGRVFIYFGTFGALKGYELEPDMVTIKGGGAAVDVTTLTGFFEAPWILKRQGTYYMLYAANNAGADSPCTPTSYHACLAYGTAEHPLGPWTFRGVFLDIVSSTTSHPGAYRLANGDWGLAYHTRDADGGTHFRRSVAVDKLTWDDSAAPPAINRVAQTKRPAPPPATGPTRNVAPAAVASSAGDTPIQYWIRSVNDGRVEPAPLPPDYWSSYAAEQSPETSTLTLTWDAPVELNGVAVAFFADQPAGSDIGVAPPASWRVEYLDSGGGGGGGGGAWKAVSAAAASFPTEATDSPAEVGFTTVSTTALRAVLTASGRGGQFAGVAVKEFFAFAPTAR
ncbi:Xylosidase/arabinosidase [Colletotrichum tanaceti]|uniref:Xylosidase/arabinosidase n=1 Tax=Colletotrichum tanaceti TaxID=1306861 RepID=A0A4U6X4J5_9PEZI|nr:Xylosidase/arabinosidase [Colletotrichum tanaceti]TKW50105.1 Xylosidase/arabinosidase [Colletotrichum tanaceti]